jgi:hypothetical protein
MKGPRLELQGAEETSGMSSAETSTKDAMAWLSEERAVSRPIHLPNLLASLLTNEDQASTADV